MNEIKLKLSPIRTVDDDDLYAKKPVLKIVYQASMYRQHYSFSNDFRRLTKYFALARHSCQYDL